jgi:Tol biopolymer transport system component/phospholipase C
MRTIDLGIRRRSLGSPFVIVLITMLAAVSLAGTGSSPASPARAAGSTKGNGWIAFSTERDGNSEIYRMEVDGRKPVNLTGHPSADTQPAWSPDGKLVAFTSRRTGNNEIFVMDADGSNVVMLTNDLSHDSQPTWSPTGDRIAFTRKLGGNREIFVMNADGSNVVRLTNRPGRDIDPAWSPLGDLIAYTSVRGGNSDIYVVAPDGSSEQRLTSDPGADSQPAWAPDGSQIAFSANRDGNAEIYVMQSDGSGQTNLTMNPAADTDPAFAPEDGYRLLFVSDRDGDPEVFVTWKAGTGQEQFALSEAAGPDLAPDWQPLVASPPSGSPIEHVVVIFMENHSFDEVLGRLCLQDGRCDSVSEGQVSTGETIPLHDAPDIVPQVLHGWFAQYYGMNGGLMNGFDLNHGCTQEQGYACYQQYDPAQIPNLAALARAFVISDRTFEGDSLGSWGAHFILASPNMNGFYQGWHTRNGPPDGPGWGCDGGTKGEWAATWSLYYEDHYPFPPDGSKHPNCVPKQDGSGPYEPSPVPWITTIMNRFDGAGLTWKIFAPTFDEGAYGWSICPTFADCLYTDQSLNHVPTNEFVPAAQNGELPNLSYVIPIGDNSQHNKNSMLQGDNWIGQQVEAVMSGPDWNSTAIFITYDDCGCFYDHVPPPEGFGIRVPMVIVSPYARPGFTDSNVAPFASMQAFIEHTFGLAPMGTEDATAYDYSDSFDYSQEPLPPIPLKQHPVPEWVIQWIKDHPPDPDDPT